MTQALLSPVSALIAHLEPLLIDRRLLVIGNARRSVAEHLLDRGARLVQVLDPDPKRLAHAAAHNGERRVTYAQLTESALRDGSYDCVLVEDVSLADDLNGLLRGAARSLNQTGIAVVCMRNNQRTTGLLGTEPGSVDYDTLCDAVDEHFDASIMLGQSAFLGYSVVQFGLEDPPEPALDNAYLNSEAEDPDFYIALAGNEETISQLPLEDMTIVQLPSARFVTDNESAERDFVRRAARRAEALESELTSLRKRSDHPEVERLARELEQRDAWIRELESRAESADARADDAQAQLDELEQELLDMRSLLVATRQDADRAVIERDEALAEDDQALAERDRALAERDRAIAERERALAERETAFESRENTVQHERSAQKQSESAQEGLLREEVEDLTEELADVALLLSRREAEVARGLSELAALRSELEEARRMAKEGQHQSVGREALESELTLLDEKNRALEAKLEERTRALQRLERRLVEHEKELDDLHEQLDETEELLTNARKELTESAGPTMVELERDTRGLEEQLRDRGHRIVELEKQLRNLEAYAKTLKVELERGPVANDSCTTELNQLALALAEREADLVAAQWRIGQLEQTVARE